MDAECGFFGRVARLPLVSSTFSQLGTVYGQAKRSNGVAWAACESCEIGARLVAFTSRPVLSLLGQPLEKLDHAACEKLDQFEHCYPALSKSPDELLAEARLKIVGIVKAAIFLPFSDLQAIEIENADDMMSQHRSGPSEIRTRPGPSEIRTRPETETSEETVYFPGWPTLAMPTVPSFVHLSWENVKGLHTILSQAMATVTADYSKLVKSQADWLSCVDARQLLCSRCKLLPKMFSSCMTNEHSCIANEHSCMANEHSCEGLCPVCWLLAASYKQLPSSDAMGQAWQRLEASLNGWMLGLVYVGEKVLVTSVEWLITLPPFCWMLPEINADSFADEDLIADDENDPGLVVHYVPVHPNDLANLPLLLPRRVYWRRRF